MHSLEVIIARNHEAVENRSAPQTGWEITHDGMGNIRVTGHGYDVVVDCSNPLLDHELVEFHRAFQDSAPNWVRLKVECLASEHRRTILVSGKWTDCLREAEAHQQRADRMEVAT